jgi:hypothetical protein
MMILKEMITRLMPVFYFDENHAIRNFRRLILCSVLIQALFIYWAIKKFSEKKCHDFVVLIVAVRLCALLWPLCGKKTLA